MVYHYIRYRSSRKYYDVICDENESSRNVSEKKKGASPTKGLRVVLRTGKGKVNYEKKFYKGQGFPFGPIRMCLQIRL